MGLDMYVNLKTHTYLGKNRKIDLDHINTNFDNFDVDEFDCSNSVWIEENVCYWRKANQIHKWFVDNCQNGVDECQTVSIGLDNINKLYNICKSICDKFDGVKFVYRGERADNKEFIFNKNNLKEFYTIGISYYMSGDVSEIVEFCKNILPTQEGFFFGDTDINSDYLYDVVKTIFMFDRLLNKISEFKKNKVGYYITYQASW